MKNPNSENPRPIVNVDSGLKALDVPRLVRVSDSIEFDDEKGSVRRIFAYNIFGGWLAYIPDGDWESKNGKIKKLFWKIGIHDSIGRKCYKLSRLLASNSPKPSLRVRWIRQWEILRLILDDLLGNKQSKQNF